MKINSIAPRPADAAARMAVKPVICYPVDTLPRPDLDAYRALRDKLVLVERITVQPRDAECWSVPAGHFCRIVCSEGPQVGDLNLFNADDLNEKFYSGKTRALNGTHVGLGDQLFSSFPYLRPMATITHDSLDWYGFDEFGGAVHDVIGTRCDPYTNNLLKSWRAVPSLLPFQPYARFCEADGQAAARGRNLYSRRAQCVHVHGLHPGYWAIFHEGKPCATGRLSGILCRDQSSWLSVSLSRGRLFGGTFFRYCRLLSDGGRDLQARTSAGRLGGARSQRI